MSVAPEPARVRVRFADTDAMGVVYYGRYLAFFETGRVEAMRQAGLLYSHMIDQGLHSPVIEAYLRYRLPARFDDVLLIDARVTEVRQARFRFDYRVQRDGDTLATGHTLHACVDARTLRPVRLPGWLVAALNELRG